MAGMVAGVCFGTVALLTTGCVQLIDQFATRDRKKIAEALHKHTGIDTMQS